MRMSEKEFVHNPILHQEFEAASRDPAAMANAVWTEGSNCEVSANADMRTIFRRALWMPSHDDLALGPENERSIFLFPDADESRSFAQRLKKRREELWSSMRQGADRARHMPTGAVGHNIDGHSGGRKFTANVIVTDVGGYVTVTLDTRLGLEDNIVSVCQQISTFDRIIRLRLALGYDGVDSSGENYVTFQKLASEAPCPRQIVDDSAEYIRKLLDDRLKVQWADRLLWSSAMVWANVVHIGAHVGNSPSDPVFRFVGRQGWRVLAVEPQPTVLGRLRQSYGKLEAHLAGEPSSFAFEGAAVAARAAPGATATMQTWPSEWIESDLREGKFFSMKARLTSNGPVPLKPGHVTNDTGEVGRQASIGAEDLPDTVARESVTIEVPLVTLADLVRRHGVGSIDVLVIDAEGSDWDIILSLLRQAQEQQAQARRDAPPLPRFLLFENEDAKRPVESLSLQERRRRALLHEAGFRCAAISPQDLFCALLTAHGDLDGSSPPAPMREIDGPALERALARLPADEGPLQTRYWKEVGLVPTDEEMASILGAAEDVRRAVVAETGQVAVSDEALEAALLEQIWFAERPLPLAESLEALRETLRRCAADGGCIVSDSWKG
jgi:hypothetical protein